MLPIQSWTQTDSLYFQYSTDIALVVADILHFAKFGKYISILICDYLPTFLWLISIILTLFFFSFNSGSPSIAPLNAATFLGSDFFYSQTT